MQLIYLPDWAALLVCFALWPVFQIVSALCCKRLPEKHLNAKSFYFRSHKWESSGQFYETVFFVRKWKKFLPDGGAVTRDGYRKKRLTDFSEENLNRFLVESCRAELTHLFAIPPFILFSFFVPAYVVVFMFVYSILVNLPCVISQRYNRPRVSSLLKKQVHKRLSRTINIPQR